MSEAESPTNIDALIADLTCDDVLKCQKARRTLVDMGSPAVAPFIDALSSPIHWVRWEAAKGLGEIGDPAAIDALVEAIEDLNFDVRWLAAEGLIRIGSGSVVPLLKAIIHRPDSVKMRMGAHHVLHDLSTDKLKEIMQPLLIALDNLESPEVPLLAMEVLNKLE
jgi:HEAT repeat protein